MNFFQKTVSRSLLWGLCSTRPDAGSHARLLSAQKYMVRKMLRVKRQPIGTYDDGRRIMEPWLDWQKRSMRQAGDCINEHNCSIVDSLAKERENWGHHVARMGTNKRPPHLLKAILMHRPLAWWRHQQGYNNANAEPLYHRAKMGSIRRWENHLPSRWMLRSTK